MMDEFQSVTGEPEMAEPLEAAMTMIEEQSSAAAASSLHRKSSISSIPTAKKMFSSQTTSATSSPRPSRESSPARIPLKSTTSTRAGPGRSRKNSSQEASPTRASSSPNPLSSAATQRALSAATTPQLYPSTSDLSVKAPAPQKIAVTTELKDVPRWPISPRLRSPPPTNKVTSGPRKAEQDIPVINVLGSTPSTPVVGINSSVDVENQEALAQLSMKGSARGVSAASSTLETVQEMSQANTPALEYDGSRELFDTGLKRLADQDTSTEALNNAPSLKPTTGANESGSESGKGESKIRAASAAPVLTTRPTLQPTKSYSHPGAGRGKASGEGSTKNMTVETETVSSIPQVAVGGGTVGPGINGSLRAKPSAETIKPKKEKKKSTRKAPSVTSGVASSKADIFEAKIASAVDEANSSDSEETFVYESNPPEASAPRRFHSRTPSATSMASQVDQRMNVRSIQGLMDSGHNVATKKSMKFTNQFNTNPDVATEDDGKGTARSITGTGRGTTHHHHIGRWGRTGGNGHPSLFDTESPFPNVAKAKLGGNSPRQSSRPTSPRIGTTRQSNGKKGSPISSGYDVDDGADDERTPLMSTVRLARSGRSRRPGGSSLRQLEHQASRQERSFMTRFAGCLVITIMMLLVISGATAFLFATTQPLSDVKISALKNVIVSGQELILDMDVTVRNPNVMVVAIDSMSMDLFAKSKHSGPESDPWANSIQARDDSPWDPPFDPDDPDETPLLLLGRVTEFDSPLLFDGSPFRKILSFASGQLHISKPGNTTEPDGSERWNRLINYEFDLIAKGTLKYQLPLSQRVRSVSVGGKVAVKPNQGIPDKTKLVEIN